MILVGYMHECKRCGWSEETTDLYTACPECGYIKIKSRRSESCVSYFESSDDDLQERIYTIEES